MQNVQSFYIFTAFGGANEKNTKYDASCRVERNWNYWTCPDNDKTKECSKPLQPAVGDLPAVPSCKKGDNCKCKRKCGKEGVNAKTCSWQCKDRSKSNTTENQDCEDKYKVCGEDYNGDNFKEYQTVVLSICPEGCKCAKWTCGDGEELDECDIEERVCEDGCKECDPKDEVCPPHMVDTEPNVLKPSWNLIRVISKFPPQDQKKMSEAIRNIQNKGVDGEIEDIAKLLWTSDGGVEKWKHDTEYRFVIHHCPNKDLITLKVFEGTGANAPEIINVEIKDKDDKSLKGGRLGVFVDSQENVKWENIFYRY